MENLILHPGCSVGPIAAVGAAISPTSKGCRARFQLTGKLAEIRIPEHEDPERTDNLWHTTCFEIFWQAEGGAAYREFNFSPSSNWAAYDFDGFRKNGRDAPVDAIAVACAHSSDHLLLTANIAADLPVPARVALNAIVENSDGTKQYWALRFEDGKPEFHSETCRALRIASR